MRTLASTTVLALLCLHQAATFAQSPPEMSVRALASVNAAQSDAWWKPRRIFVPNPAEAGSSAVGRVFCSTQHGPFDDLILSAARRWELDPFVLKGLLANESRLEPGSVGARRYVRHGGRRRVVSGGAVGIAQFTAVGIAAVNHLRQRRGRQGRFDRDGALDPQRAIFAAAELLSSLISRFGRDGGITAYNSGVLAGRAVRRYGFWRARRSGRLTRAGIRRLQGYRFVLRVLQRANWYRRQAGLDVIDEPFVPTRVRRKAYWAAHPLGRI